LLLLLLLLIRLLLVVGAAAPNSLLNPQNQETRGNDTLIIIRVLYL
jgi:hypothetical protein